MNSLRGLALLVGRAFIATVFIYDAVLLTRSPAVNIAFMERFGVPGLLLWPTAIFELVGGMLIILGLATRAAALAFVGFCLLTALIFHHQFADLSEVIQFGKDLGLTGGFLFLFAVGPGPLSLDHRIGPAKRAVRRSTV